MTTPALVSIAIPAYNHAIFIEDCLASVCAQTYPELELVLIDDGSTDKTFEIAQRFLTPYQNRFRRIHLEKRKNQGVSANSNACIEACRGEWVHLLGSDDVLHPNKVEHTQCAIAEWNDPKLALAHADCAYIGEDGQPVHRSRQKPRPPAGPDLHASRWLFLGEHYIHNPTVTLRRDAFLNIGGFDCNLPLEDLDCWLRLSVEHSIGRVPETLAYYRKHPGNSLRQRVRMLSALFKTYGKFLEKNQGLLSNQTVRNHFRQNVWRFWKRVRKTHPEMLIPATSALIQSLLRTPQAGDYLRFAELLERSPS